MKNRQDANCTIHGRKGCFHRLTPLNKMNKLLTNDLKKEMNKIIERMALDDARKKELNIIYPSLVGIAEGQREITIIVPNGEWKFTNS